MATKNGIHHVVEKNNDTVSLCGRVVSQFDMPIDTEHAKQCVKKETYLQPCKNCMKKLTLRE